MVALLRAINIYAFLEYYLNYVYDIIMWEVLMFSLYFGNQRRKTWDKIHIEVAYLRNKEINQQRCPISLKKFDKSFEETLLYCGHKFDKNSLNEYERHILRSFTFKPYYCPLCKKEYRRYTSKIVYDYDFHTKSVFYGNQLFLNNIFRDIFNANYN